MEGIEEKPLPNLWLRGIAVDISYWVMGIFSLLMFPFTFWRIIKVFRPGGYGIKGKDFYAFGWTDIFYRAWYRKIAKDFKEYGRNGYSWDDGLGLALGPRIYNNMVTYWLLDTLGTRTMMALGYLLFILNITLIISLSIGWNTAIIFCLLLAVSPTLVQAYTHGGKPEMFWWWGSALALYALLNLEFMVAGLIWSLLAFFNLPVAIMIALAFGPLGIFLSMQSSVHDFIILFLSMMPGIIKIFWRMYQMKVSGFMNMLVVEQASLIKIKWWDFSREIIVYILFVTSIWLSGINGNSSSFYLASIIFPIIALYYINWRVIYLNDDQSFRILMFITSSVYAAHMGSIGGLYVSLLIFFRYIVLPELKKSNMPSLKNGRKSMLKWLCYYILRYPHFAPQKRPSSINNKLVDMFTTIPEGSRLISETNGKIRTDYEKRFYWEYVRDLLIDKRIAQVNDIYTSMVENSLSSTYTDHFNIKSLMPYQLVHVSESLGCQYIVTFTNEMKECLINQGFEIESNCKIREIDNDLVNNLNLNNVDEIAILRNPKQITTLRPPTKSNIFRNELTFNAEQGEYIVRYRFDNRFKCFIDDKNIEIEEFRPINNVSTKFMKIILPNAGKIVLKYC